MNEKILLEKLRKLEKKYDASGQNLESYLDGLYEADFLNYWDYIRLETLLSLQVKRTSLPDEEIFIVYHQVTELYFRLVLTELEQICRQENADQSVLDNRLERINRYFGILIHSFKVMSEGMDANQFMRFRMALMPASGFQSVQFRLIEILCTDLDNLLEPNQRENLNEWTLERKMEFLYWRAGSTDLQSGKKTLTLTMFEEKYDNVLLDFARNNQHHNLRRLASDKFKASQLPESTISLLRELDHQVNVSWRMAHLHSASRFLRKHDAAVPATGGTNWQRYLPPRFQKIVFFPELWSESEIENWGHSKDWDHAGH
jgi:tryptophan 2,3-dioxygenase